MDEFKLNKKNQAISLIILIILSALVFSNTLKNSFIWDDEELILENKHTQTLRDIPFLFSPAHWKYYVPQEPDWYRPIRVLTLAVDYFFWRSNPFGYHLTNLLLHILNVIIIYFLVLKLKALASRAGPEIGVVGWRKFFEPAFITAALFATHPIHTESVSWIKNRSDLLASMFFLLSLFLFIRHTSRRGIFTPLERKPRVDFLTGFTYSCAIFLLILSLLSKEMGLMLPCILLLYIICFVPRQNRLKATLETLPFFGIVFVYFIFCRFILATAPEAAVMPKINLYLHLFAVLKTIGYYTGLLIAPIGLNADRSFSIPQSFFDPTVLSSGLLLLVIALIITRVFKFSKLFVFALLWIFIMLLPAANIIFLGARPIAEQRLYIPSLGFCLIVALMLVKFSWWGQKFLSRTTAAGAATALFIFVLTFYSAVTFRRNFDWKDSITFWLKTAKQSPNSSRVLYNLGTAYVYAGNYEKAVIYYKQTLMLDPLKVDAYHNLGSIYYMTKKFDEAVFFYQKALECNSHLIKAYNNLGFTYKFNAAEIYYNLGTAYRSLANYDEAIGSFGKAIELKPDFAAAYNNLANVYGDIAKLEEAIALYKKAIAIEPRVGQFYNNLALVYFKKKQYALAKAACDRAKELGVRNPALSKALEHFRK
ncbi:MAG: tetratricopeptide repeat protein [Candidatus Omnitrophica bacterium]|nr:tetratricopeptide repeat protein [Candidatus Omnitrophota bacterium]